jgi:hypothetical protein
LLLTELRQKHICSKNSKYYETKFQEYFYDF